MLSILIPTYNYNVTPLVSALCGQCIKASTVFEILVLDDASQNCQTENDQINSLENCSYTVLPANIGRSKIRNLLAANAKYEWLLFLDADVAPVTDSFISGYLEHTAGQKAVNGGIAYQTQKPSKDRMLRWVYGRDREALPVASRKKNQYLAFLSLNFMMPKSLFAQVKFDESLPNLRHEDTVFSYGLKQKGIEVIHIDNPVYHLGLDTFEAMLKKEHEALRALKQLLESGKIGRDYVKMGKYYAFLEKMGLRFFVSVFFNWARKSLLNAISNDKPSLFWYDVYRIGYLCSLKP